jgi:hypothetical protein
MIEDESVEDWDDFDGLRSTVRDELENIGQECQESLDNMPESLQYAPTGELLQERIDVCDIAASDIECIEEFDFEDEEFDEDDYDEDDEGQMEADRAAHEANEEGRKTDEFNDWKETAISELIDAVSNCEV